jgi:RNA polymerase sigma-70 factor (ECF subfamily)
MNKKSNAGRNVFMRESMIHLESLLRAALYMTGDKRTADNLIQETYLRAYCLWGDSERAEGYRTRLFRALAGLLHEYKNSRTQFAEPATAIFPGGDALDESQLIRFAENHSAENMCHMVGDEMLRQAIENLPFDSRLVVILSFVEGFSYQEIAEITETDIATLKSKLGEGRRLLQEELWKSATREGLVKQPSSYS